MARKDNGDGTLVKKWTWKYNGVISQTSDHLRGEDYEVKGSEGKHVPTQDQSDKLVGERVVELELRMLETYKSEELPRTVETVEFKLICRELGLEVIGSDIEVLRQAMWAKLEKAHEIKWERWYLIQIAPAHSFCGGLEVGFSLSENTIYRGVAKDGTVLMREYERGRTFGPWRYSAWPGVYQDKGGRVIACIPATEQNDIALNEFRARIRALQKKISDLVKPEVILQTLANLSNIGLPAPLPGNPVDDAGDSDEA